MMTGGMRKWVSLPMKWMSLLILIGAASLACAQDGQQKPAYLDPNLPAMKAHGVPWLIRHLDGKIALAEAIEGGKRDTRQYTKRQATWFRNQLPDFAWVEPERALAAVEGQLLALSN